MQPAEVVMAAVATWRWAGRAEAAAGACIGRGGLGLPRVPPQPWLAKTGGSQSAGRDSQLGSLGVARSMLSLPSLPSRYSLLLWPSWDAGLRRCPCGCTHLSQLQADIPALLKPTTARTLPGCHDAAHRCRSGLQNV